jgi:cobyrinic acid a,c-diamide synthase
MQQLHGLAAPRLIIAALRGGAGKTILSIGIIAALRHLGKAIAPFKKGPDYIDAGWLALAAGRPCYNLDSFLLTEACIRQSFLAHTRPEDIAMIEGNRGLFDGIDLEGSTSTAELAKLLKAPVILCVDCTKTTRTMAAVISGCRQFDPQVAIRGVILNRVAGSRHEGILRASIEHFCGLPVLGAVPKLREQNFPERHMGLVPTPEHEWARRSIDAAARVAARHVDLERIAALAHSCPAIAPSFSAAAGECRPPGMDAADGLPDRPAPRVGVLRDAAFQFYYPENLEALEAAGAEVVFVSPLADKALPELDALYIGGGFPETHAAALAENRPFARLLRTAVEGDLPVYAECGGLMYLGRELILGEAVYPMAGVLPVSFDFHKRPQGHGYTVAAVEGENPYYAVGSVIKGHEFHYSRVVEWSGDDADLVFRMQRGVGLRGDRDGIRYRNVLATYTHIHALGTPAWAASLIGNARTHRVRKNTLRA